jgi:hypothetical protein
VCRAHAGRGTPRGGGGWGAQGTLAGVCHAGTHTAAQTHSNAQPRQHTHASPGPQGPETPAACSTRSTARSRRPRARPPPPLRCGGTACRARPRRSRSQRGCTRRGAPALRRRRRRRRARLPLLRLLPSASRCAACCSGACGVVAGGVVGWVWESTWPHQPRSSAGTREARVHTQQQHRCGRPAAVAQWQQHTQTGRVLRVRKLPGPAAGITAIRPRPWHCRSHCCARPLSSPAGLAVAVEGGRALDAWPRPRSCIAIVESMMQHSREVLLYRASCTAAASLQAPSWLSADHAAAAQSYALQSGVRRLSAHVHVSGG